RQTSLSEQEKRLQSEINDFIAAAVSGEIPIDHLTFAANKVYKKEGNQISEVIGNFSEIVSKLAEINCELWHEQEKVYEFEKVPVQQKDSVVKQIAILNLQRNQCIDQIDKRFQKMIKGSRTNQS
ncbi:MAG TPA: hypothetical protein VKI62_01100, partial [Bacteroidota bacterium]|nr:hypothetical protein [Bacteroidota bacterium]